ncbi:hypothetical protein [Nocardioides sp.]|uniref:hypothetical protein n=1 Tax=Nocardioides sp. TaxID=35761 RepID=UPI0031FEEACB
MPGARFALLLLAFAVGGASGCAGDDEAGSTTTVPAVSGSSSTGPGASGPVSDGGEGSATASGTGTATASSSTGPASPSTPEGSATGATPVGRLLVAADVPGSRQQQEPGRATGQSRRVATVTITCPGLPAALPTYPTDDAFVSVLTLGGGTVSSAIRVFGSGSTAADFMAEWQRRLDVCAGDDSAPNRWPQGAGYADDSFAADGSFPGVGQSLDFYVRDGRSIADVYLLLTDLSAQQQVDVIARATEKLLG